MLPILRPNLVRGQDSIVIQRVTSDWNEKDVTWNKPPETTTENQLIIPKIEKTKSDYVIIVVTNIIYDIIKEDNGRYGIILKHQNEKPYNVVFFTSSNNPDRHLYPNLREYYRKK